MKTLLYTLLALVVTVDLYSQCPPVDTFRIKNISNNNVTLEWTSQHSYDRFYVIDRSKSSIRYYDNQLRQITYPNNSALNYEIGADCMIGGQRVPSPLASIDCQFNLQASDGEYFNKTLLTWNTLKDVATDIRVQRGETYNSLEEIAILNPNATSYTDNTAIHGKEYFYFVTPLDEYGNPIFVCYDQGYSKPNGSISGYVRSQLGAGVAGVDINVRLSSYVPPGGDTLPNCPETYCIQTNSDGYYQIDNIYYYEGASFEIIPAKMGLVPHEFSPALSERELSENARSQGGVNFTDLTVYTVGGRVTYPRSPNGITCGVENVKIFIDGEDFGVQTDQNGDWSFAIQEDGEYKFSPEFLHHNFENSNGDSYTTLTISSDSFNLDFTDVETDSLQVVIQGGCGASLGDSVEFRITSPNNCFYETYVTDQSGKMTIYDLPSRDYFVEVLRVYNPVAGINEGTILDQIGIPHGLEVNLTVRDTSEMIVAVDSTIIIPEIRDTLPNDSVRIVQEADTVLAGSLDTIVGEVEPMARFIYRAPLNISVDFEQAGATLPPGCTNSEGDPIILVDRGERYLLEFDVVEMLGTGCAIDEGFLRIYDFVSDKDGEFIKIPIINGYAQYWMEPGIPNIATSPTHNHEKLLYIVPEVDLIDPVPVEYWIMVLGAKSNAPTFFTRTPEIPSLILHDPPGDNSYAYVEAGTSFTSFTTNEVANGGAAGAYANLVIGTKIKSPISEAGFGVLVDFEIEAGRDNFNRDGFYQTITFNETFSTSDSELFTGNEGDIFIGAGYNQEYSLSDKLTFNECTPEVSIVPALADQTFATTFVYTEHHIKNTLLPNFGFLKDNILAGRPFDSISVDDQAEVNNLIADSVLWEQILLKNRIARDSTSIFKENISFSAGAEVAREFETVNTSSESYEYNVFVNIDFALGAKVINESGAWFDSEFGVMGSFRHSTTTASGTENMRHRKVGYVLNDDDLGDYFSIDVTRDTAYSVPAFNLKLGTTSCPQEPGSQGRDKPGISITPPVLTEVPSNGSANFVCNLTNLSESYETREYAVRVVSTTNPDGAIVHLGGTNINNKEASYFLPRGETVNLNLSVERGPLASQYDSIGIMIYPPCEYDIWQNNGVLRNADTAYIKVHFQSECSNISLQEPMDGWLINSNSPQLFPIVFSGYDINNPLLEKLTLQIKKEGEGYFNLTSITSDQLSSGRYFTDIDLSSFDDGAYRIRAIADCGSGGITYSSEKKGIINRSSLAPFGMPSPSDGFLRIGQDIRVDFDKSLDCNFAQYSPVVKLIRADNNEEIPSTFVCSGQSIVINTNPVLTDRPELDGVEIIATVDGLRDLNQNYQDYPTVWSFLANTSPVFWDPGQLTEIQKEGSIHRFSASLKNNSQLNKVFSLDPDDDPNIIQIPDWLEVVQNTGSILANGVFEVEFEVDNSLAPGIYTDSITALVDGFPVSFELTFELLADPINWTFDHTQYQYSMNMVVTFSLNDSDTLLTSDTRDLVGAFVNGEIRGVSNIEYIPSTNSYAAFLTVFSNDAGGGQGEEISFRFWHAITGIEYASVETATFFLDGTYGSVASPQILHPAGVFQIIPLKAGWNWISLNVTDNTLKREDVLKSISTILDSNDIIIKSKSQTATFSPGSGWNGNLKNLSLGEGYLIHLSSRPDTLKIEGFPSATNVDVTLNGTWNWIGFPRLNPEPVHEVLSGLNASSGDIVKSQNKFSQYENNWIGTLNFFEPGQGYKLNIQNGGIITYSASRSKFNVNPYEFEYNMNVTARIDTDILPLDNEKDLIVGAFIDGKCHGISEFEFVSSVDDYRTFILVQGNKEDFNKKIEFRVLDENNGKTYLSNAEQLSFIPDGIHGDRVEAYDLILDDGTFGNTTTDDDIFSVFPNPASNYLKVNFNQTIHEEYELIVFDYSGKEVKRVFGLGLDKQEEFILDFSNNSRGVYYIRLATEHFVETERVIIQ